MEIKNNQYELSNSMRFIFIKNKSIKTYVTVQLYLYYQSNVILIIYFSLEDVISKISVSKGRNQTNLSFMFFLSNWTE